MPELFNFSTIIQTMSAAADVRVIDKLLYSRKDAAYALSISVRSLDYLIASKRLNTRKMGRKIMVPAGELSRFARADQAELSHRSAEAAQ